MKPNAMRSPNNWIRQRRLIRRHYFQVRAQQIEPALFDVLAITFAPIGRSGAFTEGLFRRVGTTAIVVLSYGVTDCSGSPRISMSFQGFRARACPDGQVQYGNSAGRVFAYDAALRPSPRARGKAINTLRSLSQLELVLRMDQCCKRHIAQSARLDEVPKLPRVWLAFAPNELPEFEDTPALRRIAAMELGVPADQLGKNGELLLDRLLRDLWERAVVPANAYGNPTGKVLVDAELCTRARKALEVYEDFSELVGMPIWNPIREIELLTIPNPAGDVLRRFNIDVSQDFNQPFENSFVEELEQAMREAIGPLHYKFTQEEIFDGITNPYQPLVGYAACLPRLRSKLSPWANSSCSDDDLLRAARNPNQPLVLSGACRTQVLRRNSAMSTVQLDAKALQRRISVDLLTETRAVLEVPSRSCV